jgi:RimJ/RimL family protein N-acetyltransferase
MQLFKIFSFGKVIYKGLYESLQVLDKTSASFKGCNNEFHENREWWVAVNNKNEIIAYCGSVYAKGICIFIRAWVEPKLRGKGMQKRMIRLRLKRAREVSRIAITYTTPDNYNSANNLISCGFKLYGPEYAYGGRQMLYFMHNLG